MPWVKGQSGNPGGRKKTSVQAQATLRELALKDVDAAYAKLRENALEDGETAAILKIMALAGVKVEADAVLTITPSDSSNAYSGVATDELLKRAGFSSTLPS
jgi:hypothetical protein